MRLSERPRTWLPWALLALAVIATVLVYWPGLAGGWVFDDYPNIVDNAAIHITPGHSTVAAWVNAALSSPASFLHRPLASITFALNWYAGGGDPWPFKLTNVIIHVINGVLLYCMLRALLRLMNSGSSYFKYNEREWDKAQWRRAPTNEVSPLPSGEGGASAPGEGSGANDAAVREPRTLTPALRALRCALPFPKGEGFNASIDDAAAKRLALIVSAGWMLLPINLMAVLYVVQRMESLCQLFVLAGLWAYLHGRWMMLTAQDPVREKHGLSLAASGIVPGTLLGLTSKETAVLLPVFAFLAEMVVLRFRRGGGGIRLRESAKDEGEGADTRDSGDLRGFEPSPAPSGHPLPEGEGSESSSRPSRHFLPEGDGNGIEPLSLRERGGAQRRGEGADTRAAHVPEVDEIHPITGPSPAPSSHHRIFRPLRAVFPREERSLRTDKRLWTLFTVTLFVPAVLGFLWLLRAALRQATWAGRDFTLGQRLLTEPRVLVDYLHWTLLPNPEVLSLYHDEIVKSTGILMPWTTLGAMLLLAGLIVVAVLLRNRRPLVALGIGWFFAAQLLTATIVPLELVYEQRMYFASIGVLLAAGALLLGLRWRIHWPLLRGFLVLVALGWFCVATNLRAREWSNPLRLAVAEANRHPESARAVYEAGRQLLIASNYKPGPILDASWKYLRQAAAIPGSSALAEQAMIMIADHQRQGADADYWRTMIQKLRNQPTRQEDISALISLTNCYGNDICRFDVSNLEHAYAAALSRPHPIARLDGAYADFERDILHDDRLATEYLARAVKGDPSEPAYREDLAVLYARQGQTEQALEQIDALRRMNFAGRLDHQIAALEILAEQGKTQAP